jgi:ATP-dependent Lhr-like helicase
MVRLMLDRWLEAADDAGFNYSTLIQQIMSTIAQHGGATATELHRALCGPGPFQLVDQERFVRLLRSMAAHDLLIQAADGLLLHGPVGERHVNHYSFYAAFHTADEWRLVTGTKTLGTVPIFQPLYEGVLLIFAGKRWKVTGIDTSARVVELERSSGGNPPLFGGGGAAVSDRVRAEMVAVYEATDTPVWLDTSAQSLLAEGRAAFNRFRLSDAAVLAGRSSVMLLPWTGDRALFTATIALLGQDIEASVEGPAIQIPHNGVDQVEAAIRRLLATNRPHPDELAALIQNRETDKWDWVLDETLGCESAAVRLLDVNGAWKLFDNVARYLAQADVTVVASNGDNASKQSSAPPPVTASGTTQRPPMQLARVSLHEQEFCVFDVETTGFSPRLGDRVVEIAVVRMRGDGTVLAEWSTLVDPGRDIGATHVHGITATDVVGAPRFADVAGDILSQISGAVLVAHNFRFDHSFLAAEFARAGLTLPEFPALCTLSLGSLVQPGATSRRLVACCERLGIALPDAHDALADARATAKILLAYLAIAAERGRRTLYEIGCVPLVWPAELPAVEPSARRQIRGTGNARIERQGQQLAELVQRLPDASPDDPDTAAYLELLDRALEDRRLTSLEAAALATTAAEWGLNANRVKLIHEQYFNTLLDTAIADGVISDIEHNDLRLVGSLLDIHRDTVERRIHDADLPAPSEVVHLSASLAGLSVCFTGTLSGRINGEPISRDEAHRLAAKAELVVKKHVSKGLDLLVVADPDSRSGKARKARELGTRVVAEAVFWAAIGAAID